MTPSAKVPTHMPLFLEVRTPIIAAPPCSTKKKEVTWISRSIQDHLGTILKNDGTLNLA